MQKSVPATLAWPLAVLIFNFSNLCKNKQIAEQEKRTFIFPFLIKQGKGKDREYTQVELPLEMSSWE